MKCINGVEVIIAIFLGWALNMIFSWSIHYDNRGKCLSNNEDNNKGLIKIIIGFRDILFPDYCIAKYFKNRIRNDENHNSIRIKKYMKDYIVEMNKTNLIFSIKLVMFIAISFILILIINEKDLNVFLMRLGAGIMFIYLVVNRRKLLDEIIGNLDKLIDSTIISIVIVLIIPGLMLKEDNSIVIVILTSFFIFRALSRSVEIAISFGEDVIDDKPKKSMISGSDRIKLALKSLFEITINYSIVYFMLGIVFETNIVDIGDLPFGEFLCQCLEKCGSSINPLECINMSIGISTLTTVEDLCLIKLFQLISSMSLMYLGLAEYIGSKGKSDIEVVKQGVHTSWLRYSNWEFKVKEKEKGKSIMCIKEDNKEYCYYKVFDDIETSKIEEKIYEITEKLLHEEKSLSDYGEVCGNMNWYYEEK